MYTFIELCGTHSKTVKLAENSTFFLNNREYGRFFMLKIYNDKYDQNTLMFQ